MLMTRDRSCLLIVDVQQRLAPAVEDRERVIANCAVLLRAAAELGIPALVSEQYPRGLGPTHPDVLDLAGPDAVVEKIHFSCLGEPAFKERLRALARPQVVVAGMEAHVCVLQTALDLVAAGCQVFVVADAMSSRRAESKALALDRMRAGGCAAVTTEMVVFEWLEKAGTPEFKALSALIK